MLNFLSNHLQYAHHYTNKDAQRHTPPQLVCIQSNCRYVNYVQVTLKASAQCILHYFLKRGECFFKQHSHHNLWIYTRHFFNCNQMKSLLFGWWKQSKMVSEVHCKDFLRLPPEFHYYFFPSKSHVFFLLVWMAASCTTCTVLHALRIKLGFHFMHGVYVLIKDTVHYICSS